MPHTNASLQLKTYGQLALDLDELIETMCAPKKKYNHKEDTAFHKKLLDFGDRNNLKPIISNLTSDKYAYNRELAGFTLFYLWQAWKFALPYETETDKENYEFNKNAYAQDLGWSLPLIHALLHDRKVGPIESALLATRELCDINEQNGNEFREEVEKLCEHPSSSIRLQAIRGLSKTYPSNQEALHVLSESAIEALIKRTYDKVEKVRDWSCFELCQSVENINAKVEHAFTDAYIREDKNSEVYVEAVVGLARCGNQEVIPVICEQLHRDNVGTGWIDAAEMSQSPECLLALIDAYGNFLKTNADDNILLAFERAITDWNEG